MHISHIAIFVEDLEKMKFFYETYFGGKAGVKYTNPLKEFSSYMIEFSAGSRLELMHKPGLFPRDGARAEMGYAHLAISVGSRDLVDNLTRQIGENGYIIAGIPRFTGDGYYESVILDPEGNQVEITE
jgi:lactoylglutathione lyase